jgi:hypothetical protein
MADVGLSSALLQMRQAEEETANEDPLARARELARESAALCEQSKMLVEQSRALVRRSFELLRSTRDG